MNEVAAASAAPKRRTYFRRSTEARLLPDQVGRQGQITHLAFRLLGREKAIAFLNAHHASLGARPLDLATANAAGYVTVESAIRQMAPPCRRSEEHTSELQSLMRISYAVFCLKKKKAL